MAVFLLAVNSPSAKKLHNLIKTFLCIVLCTITELLVLEKDKLLSDMYGIFVCLGRLSLLW